MGRKNRNAFIIASIFSGAVPVLLLLHFLFNPSSATQGEQGKTQTLQFLGGKVEISLPASQAGIKDKISIQRYGYCPMGQHNGL